MSRSSPGSVTGYRFLHSALDDRTRIVYPEIHSNEQAVTAAGFWERANAFFNTHGVTVERVITDIHTQSRLDRAVVVQPAA